MNSSIRATLVYDALCRYLSAQRDFNTVFERCTAKGWPDKKSALRTTFRLQELFVDRELIRLRHVREHTPDESTWSAYTSISLLRTRLEKDWTAGDEQLLSQRDPTYRGIQGEIDRLQAALNPSELVGPFNDVKRDPELIAAASHLEQTLRGLDQQLSARS